MATIVSGEIATCRTDTQLSAELSEFREKTVNTFDKLPPSGIELWARMAFVGINVVLRSTEHVGDIFDGLECRP